jgi:glutathione S-transferase
MITLYDCTTAPSPRRTRIFLAEKGVDYECKQIDLAKGEQMSEAYVAINPRRAVPALVTEEGQVISENIAIAAYLEERYPEPPLLGTDAYSKAMVSEWNWRCEFEGLYAIAEILRNSSPHMKGRAMTGRLNVDQIPELAERGRLRIQTFWEDLNAQLENNAFVAGDSYSIADITAMVGVDFSRWVKAAPSEEFKALHDWHNKVAARESAKA